MAKAYVRYAFIDQERRPGERRRSDTVVVLVVNYATLLVVEGQEHPLLEEEKSELVGSWGSMVASLKLKGIDGRAPPGVEPAA